MNAVSSELDKYRYKRALVMGKFMPLHNGHIGLINFALEGASHVIVAVVARKNELDLISPFKRIEWIRTCFKSEIEINRMTVVLFEHDLPHNGEFKQSHIDAWCRAIQEQFKGIDAFVSSESYGDYLAKSIGITHELFDQSRTGIAISGTLIRNNPGAYTDFLPPIVLEYYGVK